MQFLWSVLTTVFVVVLAVATQDEPSTAVDRVARIMLEDNYAAIMSRLEQQQQELAALKTKVATLEAQQAMHPGRVAFKAHLSKDVTPAANQLIVFDDVRFNVGQAYHHGTFIAPYNGTYLFAVTICAKGGHLMYTDLLRNGQMIGQVLAGDTVWGACSAETTVTELAKGDDVIVQHQGAHGDSIFANGNFHSSFTGVLLY